MTVIRRVSLLVVALGTACRHKSTPPPSFDYPATRTEDVRDVLHGTAVFDPYRWLERIEEPEAVAWLTAQDARARKTLAAPEVEALWQETLKLWKGVPKAPAAEDDHEATLEFEKTRADMKTLRVVDKRTKAADLLRGIEGSEIVWAKKGFFYAFTPPDAPHAVRFGERSLRFHAVGTEQASDREVVPASHDKNDSSELDPVAITADGSRLLVHLRRSYGVVDLATWRVTPFAGEVLSACVSGNAIFFVRRDGDIVREGIVVGHTDTGFRDMSAVGPYVIVSIGEGNRTRSEIYDAEFHHLTTRTTDAGVTEGYQPNGALLQITRQGLKTPPRRLEFDPATGRETTVARAPVEFDADAFQVDSLDAKIPITVLRRKDLPLNGEAPLWVYAYGGFRHSAEQEFFAPWVTWAVHEGVFAICHVRGGLEYGERWHEAGARRQRQASIDDLHGCIAELHRRGYSSPTRTMTQGWSHGGMLVSAAAVQRPELQRMVLATVPLVDMIRFPLFGRGGISEYGDPENKEDFETLFSFSPYHRVRKGVAYPAFIITTATKDERAAPMHAAKLAAVLQGASTGDEVLLKVNWGAGHMGGGKEDANRIFAEAMAYALRKFGRAAP